MASDQAPPCPPSPQVVRPIVKAVEQRPALAYLLVGVPAIIIALCLSLLRRGKKVRGGVMGGRKHLTSPQEHDYILTLPPPRTHPDCPHHPSAADLCARMCAYAHAHVHSHAHHTP